MENPAPTHHPIHDLLRRRWSPRAFGSRRVETEQLLSLLEAARWAASSFNEQPWSFFVATADDAPAFAQMLSCLVPANQAWAKHAPVLLISVAQQNFSANDKPNRVALHDVGLASANLTIEALARGLFVHLMGGIDRDKIRAIYRIPEGYEPVAALAIGYPGDPHTLPAELREREQAPRERKPLANFVFAGAWKKPASCVG